jgi:hypothetical protein
MKPPTLTDYWVLAKLLAAQPVTINGELDLMSPAWRPLGDRLVGLPHGERGAHLESALLMRPDGAMIEQGIDDADPTASSPPTAKGERLTAHLGDLAAFQAGSRFIWPGWLVRAHFNLLSSDVKIGKTHLALDLGRRIKLALPWPDGQPPTFAAGTKTLWVAGDRHQDELRERAAAFGLSPEDVLLNASPDQPYGGCNLDDAANVDGLRDRIAAEKPGLIVIDTVWRATHRRLSREDEVNDLMDPIITIAQQFDVAILGLMHLSKDQETLGRRLEGLARAILKMHRPDLAQADRRKLTVIGNFKEPSPLGVTIRDGGCDYDFNPPVEPARNLGGRKPDKLDEAIAFLEAKLTASDCEACRLVDEWEAAGENKGTLFNAKKKLNADGRLVVDDTARRQVWRLFKNSQQP